MNRRSMLRNTFGLGLSLTPVASLLSTPAAKRRHPGNFSIASAGPRKPLTVYNNWSAYDELSDVVPLTEALAMKELAEVIRLKKHGARFEYYMMDAFWFDQSGGYRTWHKERWPAGPDAWINACKANGIIPGMWFSTNNRIESDTGYFLDLIDEWKDAAATNQGSLCLFRGGYAKHLADTLQLWADKGVGMFKFDFANFTAATPEAEQLYLRSEIEERNKQAFIDILKQLRLKNPDIVLVGYNGFGGEHQNTYTPFRKSVDSRWLEVFDTLYCGDPRFSDVPTMNIWRSMDIFSDHMVRQYELNGLPLHRIDNCGFMVGTMGTNYKRGLNAWKGALILEFARGGWMNVYHGNLELFSEKDAQWFAKAEQLFLSLQQYGTTRTFGDLPGHAKAYGFLSSSSGGSVCTIINPSQAFTEIDLPVAASNKYALIYADGGFKPVLKGSKITLGPEQLAVVGFDEYANQKYNLGIDETIRIPETITPLQITFNETAPNTITGKTTPVKATAIRILFQQFGTDGFPVRTWGGSPPKGKRMDAIFKIKVLQGTNVIPTRIHYDKIIWSGLSWAAAELNVSDFKSDQPFTIECSSGEPEKRMLKAAVYAVSYKSK